tara:strand:- start:2974 stop:3498 length:525 start_codon:yes stop_codon:yes gene_type:complete
MATESAIKALSGNYEDRTLLVTFQVAEGNATAVTVKGPRGDMSGVTYAAPVAKGDLVKISSAACYTVAKNDGAVILGIAQSEPIGPVNVSTTQAAMVTAKTLRTVTVELFGKMIREVKLAADAGAVALGMPLTSADGQTFTDAGAGTNNCIALADAGAASGDTIPVLFGFYGAL